MTRYPVLGFDPAPGDVDSVRSLADTLSRALTTLTGIRTAFIELGDPGAAWRGEAARAFAQNLGELPPYLARAEDSHHEAREALSRWAHDLERLQTAALRLEEQAAAASREAAAAAGAVAAARRPLPLDAAASQQADAAAALARAAGFLAGAEEALEQARRQARELAEQHATVAGQVAAAVAAAADHAPVEPGFFERLGASVDGVVDFVESLPGKAWDFVEAHANVIAEIADVLSETATLLGFVALLLPPPASIVVGTVAVGAGLLGLAGHAVADKAGVDIPVSTYVFDVVGVVAGGFGTIAAAGKAGSAAFAAESALAGRAGGVAAARESMAYYTSMEAVATTVGNVTTLASTTTGVLTSDGDDNPFFHFVPDNAGEAVLGAGSPGAVAFVSAVSLGVEKDRAAAAAAERDRWLR